MTRETHAELIKDLDQFMVKCRNLLPDKYGIDKNMAFQRLREASHWIRDIFELSEYELQRQIMEDKFKNGKSTKPTGGGNLKPVG